MSSISMIPHDLLSDIMLECDSFDMSFTLCLAEVSTRWRAVALDSRRLWAKFRLESSRDIRALPLFLARSDPVPLHIKLHFIGFLYSPTTTSTADERAQAVGLLAHCASRIRYLHVLRGAESLYDVLLATGLHFGILKELKHDYDPGYGTPALLSLSAPQITRMRLDGVISDRWDAILGHHLTALSIWGKFEPFIDTQLLRVIFLGCPKLQELLLQEYVELPSEDLDADMRMPAFTSHMPAPALRRLDIHSHSDNIATILAGLSEVFIPSISISTPDDVDFDGHPLLYDLMRGISPLVSITVDDDQHVLLVDAIGNEREILVETEGDPHWDFSVLWAILVRRHGVQSTIRMISIGAGDIHRLSPAFSDSLPASGPRFTFRIQFDETFDRDLKYGNYDEHGDYAHVFLACPPQSRVCLEGDWTDRSALQHMLALVRCSTHDVEICLGIVDDAATHDEEVKPDLLRSLREDLSQAHQCQWSLCTDCVSSAH